MIRQTTPEWKTGDSWIVETTTVALQNSAPNRKVTTQWSFKVEKETTLQGIEVVQIDIEGVDRKSNLPKTILWINRKNGGLKQLSTQVPVAGGWQWVTESYSSKSSSPVIGALTALPVDMPIFDEDRSKSTGTFEYEAFSGKAGTKAVGEIGFTFSIQQATELQESSRARGLTHKSLEVPATSKLTEIELRRFDRKVKQLWQGSLPWPVFSSNGPTESRLVKVRRAK